VHSSIQSTHRHKLRFFNRTDGNSWAVCPHSGWAPAIEWAVSSSDRSIARQNFLIADPSHGTAIGGDEQLARHSNAAHTFLPDPMVAMWCSVTEFGSECSQLTARFYGATGGLSVTAVTTSAIALICHYVANIFIAERLVGDDCRSRRMQLDTLARHRSRSCRDASRLRWRNPWRCPASRARIGKLHRGDDGCLPSP